MTRGLVPYLALAAILIGGANFASFMAETFPMGLIPWDGFVRDSHYWLWSKNEGGYIEVSRSFYDWIRLQGISIYVTHPLAIASMFLLQGSPPLRLPRGIESSLQLLGAVVLALLLFAGIVWVIPQFGVFGWVWTAWLVIIGVLNARRYFGRRR